MPTKLRTGSSRRCAGRSRHVVNCKRVIGIIKKLSHKMVLNWLESSCYTSVEQGKNWAFAHMP